MTLRTLSVILVAGAIAIGAAASASAAGGTAWTGSGPGTATVVSDGTNGPAVFSYNLDLGSSSGVPLSTWTFSTTAASAGTVTLPWRYTGSHSFFTVTVGLTAFVTHDSTTTTTTLVNDSSPGCYTTPCTPPSGGFSYDGTTTLDVAAGDTYGFTMSGSNGDSESFLRGTLTLGPTLTTQATTPAAVGSPISDTATLAGTTGGAQGTITFDAYADSACGTAPVHTATVDVSGDGTYADPGFTPATAGTYYWTALYSGDGATTTLGALDACGSDNETSVVEAGPSLTTTATAVAAAGQAISDTAALSGTNPGAQGSITFDAYSDSACSTAPVHTATVSVSGDGSYADPGFTPSASGTYYWTASYSGDDASATLPATEGCGGANESSVVSAGNDAWPRAQQITLDSSGNGGASASIDLSGQARWYKFDVTPGGDVQIDLSSLPANYDLALFSDIGQAYDTLTSTSDLTQIQAETGNDAFSPSVFSPSVFSPSVFSPSVFSPSVFSPSVFSPSVFSPSVFSPSVFSPSVFSPDPTVYQGAQIRSLIGISANDGTADEHVYADVWSNTGSFYIRVNGRNGTYDPGAAFALHVHENSGTCTGVSPSSATLLASPAPATSAQTVVLTDYGRMTGYSASDMSTMEAKIASFASASHGAVVDVGASPRVAALNAQADATPDCPYAKNLVAGAIKDVVSAYRSANPGVKSVVVVGSDHVIPFFRYPDTAGLGPESSYVPPVLDTSASQAALKSDDVLSQDAYGSSTVLHLKGVDLPIPDLPVGRLVETPAEISTMLDAYLGLAGGVVATPKSSLVTGYDFMASGAQSVESDLAAGLGSGATNDTLITNQGVAPSDTGAPPLHSWTATQLRAQLLGKRHDLVYLGGHFSANNALAADYATTLNSTDLASSSVDLTNSIVFSAGCHSGYTIVDGDAVPNVTQPLDWTEAFAQKGATLIAGTGYQYGDTDFLAYSQQLYADFAHALRLGTGPVAVGSALVAAKKTYLAATPNLQGIDVKSLLESTLYGLPMLSVNLPSGRVPQGTSSSIVSSTTPFATDPGATLGLSYFDHTFTPSLTTHTQQLVDPNGSSAGQPVATWLSGPNGVATSPGAPALPLESDDVGVGGVVLRGVGFRGGTFSDSTGITPLTGAPATELNGVHSPFVSSAFFPSRLWTVNYFGGLTGGPASTRLMLTPAQYESDAPGSATDLQRAFSSVSLRLFYSGNTSSYGGNTPALAAPPTIARVDASASGGSVTFTLHVVGDPSAGIQQAWVTYAGVHAGRWESLDLTQDATDSTLWSGTLSGLTPDQIAALRFVVQAANGVGLVSLDDNQGAYYRVGAIPPALQSSAETRTATTLALSSPPSGAGYGSSVPVSATLSANGSPLAGEQVTFSVGGSSATAVTGADGVASTHLPLVDLPGSYALAAAFDGDAAYTGSSDSSPFAIAKLPTTLAVAGGGTIPGTVDTGVTATLKSGGVGLSQRSVAFVLTPSGGGAALVQTRITDLLGQASLGPVSQLAAGTYAVTAVFGTGAPVPLPSDPVYDGSSGGPVQLTVLPATTDGLVSLVQSLGLPNGVGTVLTVSARLAASDFSRGRTAQGCQALDTFSNGVFVGLANPRLTVAEAEQLVALDAAAEIGYGCIPASSPLPAGEAAVLRLVDAIDALPTTSGRGHIVDAVYKALLRGLALDIGTGADGDTRLTCRKLGVLQTTVSSQLGRKLAADQAATLEAAVTDVQLAFGC